MYLYEKIIFLKKCEKYEKFVKKQKYFDKTIKMSKKCVKIIKHRKLKKKVYFYEIIAFLKK